MPELAIILTTAPNAEVAESIARKFVEERLVACVNIVPGLRSIYHWEGKICEDLEVLLLLKTERRLQGELEARLHEIHPYETPEFVVVEASYVAPKYQRWLGDVLQSNKQST